MKQEQKSHVFTGKLFVTVGNGKFDELIKTIDELKKQGILQGNVLCQIGHGSYKPNHCEYYTFKPTLKEDEQNADLVISHGGPGCIFELLRMNKKVIGIPNRNRTDVNHQVEFLQGLFEEGTPKQANKQKSASYFMYCDNINFLQETFEKLHNFEFIPYTQADCNAEFIVKSFIARSI